MSKAINSTIFLTLFTLLTACSHLSYYHQAITGQFEISQRAQAISEVLASPSTSPTIKQTLSEILTIRAFASQSLSLPDNLSYTYYADLQRPFVVWTVFAAPAFSFQPKQWCFPIIGCVSYRGYFSQAAATEQAEILRQAGYEVYVAGVAAYSTLGWFTDPILNTMLHWNLTKIAGIIFHELAHQQLYIPNNTAFNEAFAMTVENEGIKRWLAQHGTPQDWQRYQTEQQRENEFVELVLTTRDQLENLYQQPLVSSNMQLEKQATFEELLQQYQQFKQRWHHYAGYDNWINTELNNAKLLSVATYQDLVPVFQALLVQVGGDLPKFYQKAADLGKLSRENWSTEIVPFLH